MPQQENNTEDEDYINFLRERDQVRKVSLLKKKKQTKDKANATRQRRKDY